MITARVKVAGYINKEYEVVRVAVVEGKLGNIYLTYYPEGSMNDYPSQEAMMQDARVQFAEELANAGVADATQLVFEEV